MDTKLKKVSHSSVTKGIAFILAIACFAVSISMFANLVRNSKGFEALTEKNFLKSNELYNYQQDFYVGLSNLLRYKSEENIKAGNTIDKANFENRIQDMFFVWFNQINDNMYSEYEQPGESSRTEIENKISQYELLKEKFKKENAEKIDSLYKPMIEADLQSYYSLLERVKNKEGLYYYATNGENTFTNCSRTDRDYFAGFKAYYLFDKDSTEIKPENKNGNVFWYNQEVLPRTSVNKIYIAVTDEFIGKMQGEWDRQNDYLEFGIKIIVAALVLMLAAFVYLIWRAGRKTGDGDLRLMAVDRLYTDINIAGIITLTAIWGGLFNEFMSSGFLNYPITSFRAIKMDFVVLILFNLIFGSIGLGLLLSLVRHFKNKTLLRRSLIIIILRKLLIAVRTILKAGTVSFKVAAAFLAGELVVFILTAMMITINSPFAAVIFLMLCALSVGGIYYLVSKIKPFEEIIKGVRKIKEGKLEHAIDIKGDDTLAMLAKDINTIADGLKNAVAKELKAERMKTELITNVSHDLKTPLTSIINYVDLLSKEKLTPEEANDYVAVLKQKSLKLKNLTQDLFEISKVQSGNISIEKEKIDAALLVRQSLAELDEQIAASKLDFKVNIQEGNTDIMADGKRLSRVFENLILNILKYSLENTRVYINVFSQDDSLFIEFKNIANYEMNFREDEILERFVRGDMSRTTDGSGLGLAIAESYVAACGGSLKISVDGDLFKARIKMQLAVDR